MAQDNRISTPGSFGGLMRYEEEYPSKINIKPAHVIVFLILIVGIRILLQAFLS